MKRRQAATEEQRQISPGALKDEEFLDFLTAVMESGARPGEIMLLTAEDGGHWPKASPPSTAKPPAKPARTG